MRQKSQDVQESSSFLSLIIPRKSSGRDIVEYGACMIFFGVEEPQLSRVLDDYAARSPTERRDLLAIARACRDLNLSFDNFTIITNSFTTPGPLYTTPRMFNISTTDQKKQKQLSHTIRRAFAHYNRGDKPYTIKLVECGFRQETNAFHFEYTCTSNPPKPNKTSEQQNALRQDILGACVSLTFERNALVYLTDSLNNVEYGILRASGYIASTDPKSIEKHFSVLCDSLRKSIELVNKSRSPTNQIIFTEPILSNNVLTIPDMLTRDELEYTSMIRSIGINETEERIRILIHHYIHSSPEKRQILYDVAIACKNLKVDSNSSLELLLRLSENQNGLTERRLVFNESDSVVVRDNIARIQNAMILFLAEMNKDRTLEQQLIHAEVVLENNTIILPNLLPSNLKEYASILQWMGFNPYHCDMALSHYSSAIETEKARLLGLAKACQQLGITSNGFDILNQMAIFDELYGKDEAHSLPVTQQDPRIRQEALTTLSAVLRKAIEVYNAEGNGTTISLDRFELKTNKKTNLMTLEFAYSVHLVPNTE